MVKKITFIEFCTLPCYTFSNKKRSNYKGSHLSEKARKMEINIEAECLLFIKLRLFGRSFLTEEIPTDSKQSKNSLCSIKEGIMESRIALIGIVVSNFDSVDALNHLLSEYGKYIVGRMGIPYREKGVSIISVAMDAPNDVISALSGKIGMLPGISTKTIYAKVPEK